MVKISDCLFCKIIAGEIPADKVYENDDILAFRDIAPKAPLHVLVVPKKHIDSLEDLGDEDAGLMGRLSLALRDIARQEDVASKGYRIINNCGAGAGQEVFHIHFHLLAGDKKLSLD